MNAKHALTLAIAWACGSGPDTPQQAKPEVSAASRDASPPAIDAKAVQWPTIDDSTFLSAVDIAKACGVAPKAVRLAILPPTGSTRDSVGEDRVLYTANVARASQPKGDLFMGIVVQARENPEQAAKLHATTASIYKPVGGTDLQTHRLARNGWVRREVHGRHTRFVYSIFETDDEHETVICDDTELLAVARLLESRLP